MPLLPHSAARRRVRRWSSAALALLVAMTPATAAADSARVTLPSPNPSTVSGTGKPLDPGQVLTLRVWLADRPGLTAAATAVSDPHSPDYAHYRSPEQFQREFGPTPARASAVHDWLTGQGMTVTETTAHYLAITTTADTFDKAFATHVSEFDTPSPQGVYRQVGVEGDLSVPAELGRDILGVTGFRYTQLPSAPPSKPKPAHAAAHRSASRDASCSHYWGEHTVSIPPAYGQTTAPTPICGYTPQQIRQAYGLESSPYTGKGATVAILLDDRNPEMLADANHFFADHGMPGFAPGQYTETEVSSSHCSGDANSGSSHANGPGGLVGQWIESAIDVEAVHMAAPDAKVVYVKMDCQAVSGPGSEMISNGLDAAIKVVDERLADIATGSWSQGEQQFSPAELASWDSVLEQGALEGIGFNFSSGDHGDTESGDPVYVAFPADDPWATDVGGTSLALGSDGSVVGETVWGRHSTRLNADGTGYQTAPPGDFAGGSGGGVSPHYPQPSYQRSAVPAALSTLNGTRPAARVGPDISLDAGISALIGYTGSITEGKYDEDAQGGGTSLSSPLMAGIEADVVQAVKHPLGFFNPLLYSMRESGAIRDILPVDPAHPPVEFGIESHFASDPELFTEGEDGVLQVTPGYDDATGLGVPSATFVTRFSRP
ncbi:S53 family peptidase [Amycolatopsis pigmentata]|uniref:Protease pro-enzyme activation domain-containing protein n=1 Tax=Amycolatopsis pigmentata TaxID=450801 RepID=A0ABW5FSX2_9PSEU